MQEKLKQQVLNAFVLLMRPVVRILFRYGIGYREFVEAVKMAFVDVASSDFGLRGRPTNISRVAVITGLTRKEVKRLRDRIESGDSSISVKSTPLADVLHYWHSQDDYTDSGGRPLALSYSDGPNSFTDLVKKFGGDIPAGAMRTELKRVGAVTEDSEGRLSVTKRHFKSESQHENLITLIVHGAYAMMSNIAHNTDADTKDDSWAHRIAFTKALPGKDSRQLRRITKDRIVEFAESVDDVFMAYEALHDDGSSSGKQEAVAVGVFYFQEEDEHAKYDW